MRVPRVLSIAGTDPTGGAGIQADLKSIGALGGYGMAVVTTLVAQNTRGVRDVHVPPAGFLAAQLRAVSDDVEIDAVKIGMLHSAPLVETVRAWLDDVEPPIVVLDPVMVATSGDRLLDHSAEQALRDLCARADLVTPNVPELAALTGRSPADDWAEALAQARELAGATGAAVLLKGGHLAGEDCPDALVTRESVHEVGGRRVVTQNTHGTGCSLSAAMATLRAAGLPWEESLEHAKHWLAGAIESADALDVGGGAGPVDHFHAVRTRPRWTDAAWRRTADVRGAAERCDFVEALADGTLEQARFEHYLAQDAVYLREYSHVLGRAGELAGREDERAFWAASARSALEEEARLHRVRIGAAVAEPVDATRAYVDHLTAAAARGSYAELVAAVLPCFWLYADLGERLRASARPDHPYRDWLAAYGDPAFAAATRRAIEIADAAAAEASVTSRARMTDAFRISMHHELSFFDAF